MGQGRNLGVCTVGIRTHCYARFPTHFYSLLMAIHSSQRVKHSSKSGVGHHSPAAWSLSPRGYSLQKCNTGLIGSRPVSSIVGRRSNLSLQVMISVHSCQVTCYLSTGCCLHAQLKNSLYVLLEWGSSMCQPQYGGDLGPQSSAIIRSSVGC